MRNKLTKLIFLALMIAIGTAGRLPGLNSHVDWQVISNGGTGGSSSAFRLNGTVSQTAVKEGGSTKFMLKHGFWQEFITFHTWVCGDANHDGISNVSDAVWIINYVFAGGPPPNPLASGDANCDGSANVSDAVYIINYVFAGGHTPCDTNGDGVPDC